MKNYFKHNKYLLILMLILSIVYIGNIIEIDASQVANQSSTLALTKIFSRFSTNVTKLIIEFITNEGLVENSYVAAMKIVLTMELLMMLGALFLITIYNKAIAVSAKYYDYILMVIVSGYLIYAGVKNSFTHLTTILGYNAISIAIVNFIVVIIVTLTLVTCVSHLSRNFRNFENDKVNEDISFSLARISMFVLMLHVYKTLFIDILSSISLNLVVMRIDQRFDELRSILFKADITIILYLLAVLLTVNVFLMRSTQSKPKYSFELVVITTIVVLTTKIPANDLILFSYGLLICAFVFKMGSIFKSNKMGIEVQP